jgi:hypothetical protein
MRKGRHVLAFDILAAYPSVSQSFDVAHVFRPRGVTMSATVRSLQCNVIVHGRLMATALLLAVSCALPGCGSRFGELPTELGGLPAGAPARPAVQPAYPAVHDMPPERATVTMTDEELKRAQAELTAARDRQTNPPPRRPKPPPPARKDPNAEAAGTTRNP